jgi:hypothetical protein
MNNKRKMKKKKEYGEQVLNNADWAGLRLTHTGHHHWQCYWFSVQEYRVSGRWPVEGWDL